MRVRFIFSAAMTILAIFFSGGNAADAHRPATAMGNSARGAALAATRAAQTAIRNQQLPAGQGTFPVTFQPSSTATQLAAANAASAALAAQAAITAQTAAQNPRLSKQQAALLASQEFSLLLAQERRRSPRNIRNSVRKRRPCWPTVKARQLPRNFWHRTRRALRWQPRSARKTRSLVPNRLRCWPAMRSRQFRRN